MIPQTAKPFIFLVYIRGTCIVGKGCENHGNKKYNPLQANLVAQSKNVRSN